MSLKLTIETEYKNALKSKDKTKISTYRLILSSIKDLDIQNRSGPNKKETDDEDIKKLFKKMVKQRAESIEIYKKNNRTDLLEVEQNEYDIISSFLPKVLGDEETKKICEQIITKLGASSLKDMGKVMGLIKAKAEGKVPVVEENMVLKHQEGNYDRSSHYYVKGFPPAFTDKEKEKRRMLCYIPEDQVEFTKMK